MKFESPIDIVATRTFADADGKLIQLEVSVPVPREDRGFQCLILLSLPTVPLDMHSAGMDTFQAICMAISMARAIVLNYVRAVGPLYWLGNSNLGLDFRAVTLREARRRPRAADRETIAERAFTNRVGEAVILEIGRPKKEIGRDTWECSVRLSEAESSELRFVSAADSLEALALAIGLATKLARRRAGSDALLFFGKTDLRLGIR